MLRIYDATPIWEEVQRRHGRRSAAGAGVSARRICVRTGPLTAAALGRGGRCLRATCGCIVWGQISRCWASAGGELSPALLGICLKLLRLLSLSLLCACATQSCLGFIRKHGHRERPVKRAGRFGISLAQLEVAKTSGPSIAPELLALRPGLTRTNQVQCYCDKKR